MTEIKSPGEGEVGHVCGSCGANWITDEDADNECPECGRERKEPDWMSDDSDSGRGVVEIERIKDLALELYIPRRWVKGHFIPSPDGINPENSVRYTLNREKLVNSDYEYLIHIDFPFDGDLDWDHQRIGDGEYWGVWVKYPELSKRDQPPRQIVVEGGDTVELAETLNPGETRLVVFDAPDVTIRGDHDE